MEQGITKQQIISVLTKSPHGNLSEFVPVGSVAASKEPEFLAHLIAWNQVKGQIRDSKVALPVIQLAYSTPDNTILNNALAHLAMLDPRNLLRSLEFIREVKTDQTQSHRRRVLSHVVEPYLRAREANPHWWDATVVQHRQSMKALYALNHIKPSTYANEILFDGKKVGVFKEIAELGTLTVREAASVIVNRKLPFLVTISALGQKAKDPDLLMSMIDMMTPTELVTNTAMLEKLGMKTNPAVRASFDAALKRVAESKKVTLKTSQAVASVKDENLKEKLRGVQEKQVAQMSIKGNWLVLGDKSGSMQQSIETARVVAATLAKMVDGRVHLVFFDTSPRYMDVSGWDYDKIAEETRFVGANGGTSCGVGIMYLIDRKIEVDGIVIISDGGERQAPFFGPAVKAYNQIFGKDVPVYFYRVSGDPDSLSRNMQHECLELQVFDLGENIDYYSLPNLVQTMRVSRYSLIDEIMEAPLLTLEKVFAERKKAA